MGKQWHSWVKGNYTQRGIYYLWIYGSFSERAHQPSIHNQTQIVSSEFTQMWHCLKMYLFTYLIYLDRKRTEFGSISIKMRECEHPLLQSRKMCFQVFGNEWVVCRENRRSSELLVLAAAGSWWGERRILDHSLLLQRLRGGRTHRSDTLPHIHTHTYTSSFPTGSRHTQWQDRKKRRLATDGEFGLAFDLFNRCIFSPSRSSLP